MLSSVNNAKKSLQNLKFEISKLKDESKLSVDSFESLSSKIDNLTFDLEKVERHAKEHNTGQSVLYILLCYLNPQDTST